jgi:crossover junction endodeoxyribonuclease RusA
VSVFKQLWHEEADSLEPDFPFEFLVAGTPVSLQSKNSASREGWKARVRAASMAGLPEAHWATSERIAVTMFYFTATPMTGDLDNIVKLVLDALVQHIYLDDAQVDRIVVQKFEPHSIFAFSAPSPTLQRAIVDVKPLLYLRLSTDPFEELS